ncbi:MAG: hypothetical protein JST04_14770 [Bdellovibrionales bacterium]|nr:hypothetical protein [Bdellovibrionales bacterium]
MREFGILLMLGIGSGCATAASPIVGPDGTEHMLVKCSQIEDCYEEARIACGGKYKIVNTNTETYQVVDTVTSTTKLLVKCTP